MAGGDGAHERANRHAPYEDVIALALGTLFVAVGSMIYGRTMLMTGGTVGLALLIQYLTKASFWLVFSLVNLPFYALAVVRLGWAFALRTFIAVSIVSGFAAMLPRWIDFAGLDPVFAAIFGGALMGNGLLMLFRHRTGLGGINILAIYLQEHYGLRAGWVQLGIDGVLLLAAAILVLGPGQLALSLLGAVVVNAILGINHKPGRYTGLT